MLRYKAAHFFLCEQNLPTHAVLGKTASVIAPSYEAFENGEGKDIDQVFPFFLVTVGGTLECLHELAIWVELSPLQENR